MRIFTATPPKVLALALETLTKSSERMPTPGHLSKAIEITYEKHPELCPDRKLWGAEGKDPKGVPCIYWSDEKMVPAYKAKDCPEGRAFLKLLREIAGKKSINNAAPPHANGG